MDAEYLNKNIVIPLTEGLTSVAIKNPDDAVDYLGRYLVAYAERQLSAVKKKTELDEVETKLVDAIKVEAAKVKIAVSVALEKSNKENVFETFLNELRNGLRTKEEAMDATTNFIQSYFNIPASFIAVKKSVGDQEMLNYLSAGPSQEIVRGKRILKTNIEEGEEIPPAQGISFDAFKIPESPPDGNAEEEEGAEEKPPKPPLIPQPLIIDNVIREKRCKFFGIPKIGSMVVVPFSFPSIDHANGCIQVTSEEGAVSIALNKIETWFIITVDSIGSYRLFKQPEIEGIQRIGNTLIELFESIEKKMGESQLAFMNGSEMKLFGEIATEVTAACSAEEATALTTVVIPEGTEDAPTPEGLKPFLESTAIVKSWGKGIASSTKYMTAWNYLQKQILPLPMVVGQLLIALVLILGWDVSKTVDVCGDFSWDLFKKNYHAELIVGMEKYDPSAVIDTNILKESSLRTIKALCETNNIFDNTIYPTHLPILNVITGWLQKAITAREAAINYHMEVLKKSLE